jgi:hypothetical protein
VTSLWTAVAFIVFWLAGGFLSPQAVTVLIAALAVGACIGIWRAWRLLRAAAT